MKYTKNDAKPASRYCVFTYQHVDVLVDLGPEDETPACPTENAVKHMWNTISAYLDSHKGVSLSPEKAAMIALESVNYKKARVISTGTICHIEL